MPNTRDKVIAIAKAEVGYLEKSRAAYQSNNNIIYDKTAGAGYDNYTKYGKEMHDVYPAIMDFPAAWCDAFVDWCFYKAYGVTTAKSLLAGNFDDYTVSSAGMYQAKGALDTTPEIGAQIFFTNNGKTSGCYHTGLVVGWDGTLITTIEGNTSNSSSIVPNGGGVHEKTYYYANNKNKMIFGHPKYDDSNNTSSVKAPSQTTSTTNFKQYAAVVNVNTSLTRRSGPGTMYPEVIINGQKQYFNPGMVVSICEERNGFGRLTDVNEWISLSYLKK